MSSRLQCCRILGRGRVSGRSHVRLKGVVMAGKVKKIVRDAATGRIVKKEEATKRPKETVTETVKPTKKKH